MIQPGGTITEVADGIAVWVNSGCGWGASNAALIAGHRSSLLVDTLWDLPSTAAMLDALAPRLLAAPVAQLVNTHSDGDHWFGNSLAGAQKRIATRAAARSMARHGPGQMRALGRAGHLFRALGSLPFGGLSNWRLAADYFDAMVRPWDFSLRKPLLPNFVFSGSLQLKLGNRDVRLVELGPAHTSGDLAVLLPDDRVLLAGDLVFAGVLPVLWDGSLNNWIRACDWLLDQRVDVVVPGHGPIGGLQAVEDIRRFWEYLNKAARYQFGNARPPAVAARWIVTAPDYHRQPFSAWAGQERIVIDLHSIYRRLMKRGRKMGVWDRLMALKDAAVFADELSRAGGIGNLKPR
jgi:cyclase